MAKHDLGQPRIDDSHHPFKRKARLGPGPRKRPPIQVAGEWECVARKPTKTHYVTACRYVGEVEGMRGKVRTIKTKKARKKKYNKIYRAWRKRHKGPVARRSGYSCHRTAKVRCK